MAKIYGPRPPKQDIVNADVFDMPMCGAVPKDEDSSLNPDIIDNEIPIIYGPPFPEEDIFSSPIINSDIIDDPIADIYGPLPPEPDTTSATYDDDDTITLPKD